MRVEDEEGGAGKTLSGSFLQKGGKGRLDGVALEENGQGLSLEMFSSENTAGRGGACPSHSHFPSLLRIYLYIKH